MNLKSNCLPQIWSECPVNNLMEKKPLQSLNDTDKQFMNIGPNYLSCISNQQQTS